MLQIVWIITCQSTLASFLSWKKKSSCSLLLGNDLHAFLQQSPLLQIAEYFSQQIANIVLMMLFKSWPEYECQVTCLSWGIWVSPWFAGHFQIAKRIDMSGVRTPVNVVRFKRCTTMDFSMTLLLIMSMRKRKKYIFFPGHLKKMQHGSQLILKVNLIPPGTGTKNQMRICILVKPGTSADNWRVFFVFLMGLLISGQQICLPIFFLSLRKEIRGILIMT